MKLPKGTWAEITTKSGLGSKGQLVFAGVIDEEYRGIPHVIMTNLRFFTGDISKLNGGNVEAGPIYFKKGDKLAQMIISPYCNLFNVVQVDKVETETSRGEGGFGSTGSS
jgi:dUTPase